MVSYEPVLRRFKYRFASEEARPEPTEEAISGLERLVGGPLPAPYRTFLKRYGGGGFHFPVEVPLLEPGCWGETHVEFFVFYGTGPSWDIVDAYEPEALPPHFLPFAQNSGADLFCICCGGDNYGKIFYWDHHFAEDPPSYKNVRLCALGFEAFMNGLQEAPSVEVTPDIREFLHVMDEKLEAFVGGAGKQGFVLNYTMLPQGPFVPAHGLAALDAELAAEEEALAQRTYHGEMQLSTLSTLESYLLSQPNVESDGALQEGASRYLGEVFRNAMGGRWAFRTQEPTRPVIAGYAETPTEFCPGDVIADFIEKKDAGFLERAVESQRPFKK